MNNLFFKSDNRLIKNSSITLGNVMTKLLVIQGQNRALRQDMVDIKLMVNKLLIDKHLQMQVDEYFEHENSPEDSTDID